MSEVKPRKEIRCKPELWERIETLSKLKGFSFNKTAESLLEMGLKYNSLLETATTETEQRIKEAATSKPVETKKTVNYMGLSINPDKIKI